MLLCTFGEAPQWVCPLQGVLKNMLFQRRSEDPQRTFRGRSEAFKGPLEALTGRSGAFKGRSEALRGRSEDVQATLRGRSEDVQRRSGAFRGLLETPPPPPLGISSLREFALCYSRYPPTRACGWVVGSRPDGDGMAGTAGTAGCLSKSLVLHCLI